MSEITLGKYLFERLKQVNVNTIFGLPGDFNLSLLDKIYEVDGLRWAGNANELNAAYAADGYARIKGLSVLVTTFGVGELSALNGIAGSGYKSVPVPTKTPANKGVSASTPLKQEWLWNELSKFLQEGDVIISETGTSAFGINQTIFPKDAYGISQVLWGSIGFTTGATLGAAFAAEEIDPNKRVILFIGDGSLQLTVQEISTMIRWGLKSYLFVLNNDGYTIEKLIHGPHAEYNGNPDLGSPRPVARIWRSAAGAFGPELSRKLSQLVKIEKNVLRSMELTANERRDAAKQLSIWGLENDDDVSDITDKLGVLIYEVSELDDQFIDRYDQYRLTLKSIRDIEGSVQPSRDRKDKITDKIAYLKYKDPQSPKIEVLEQNWSKLRAAFNYQFDSIIEHSEKIALIAGYGKALLELLDDSPVTPGETRPAYDGITKTSNLKKAKKRKRKTVKAGGPKTNKKMDKLKNLNKKKKVLSKNMNKSDTSKVSLPQQTTA
ncbi:Pyruvate decarboxylase 1 [Fusarium falciforme]|nr:Pyruvate decarboxylase 1 [Fusarium falciforme]